MLLKQPQQTRLGNRELRPAGGMDEKPKKEENRLIEVKNLVKKYDGQLALDNLSFTVEQGKILGFLGPNGAGKSTTMNIMTGYISATDGTVTIDGFDILDDPEEAKKSIGYLPELPPLYPDMTVQEYLNFVAELKGIKKKDRAKEVTRAENLTKTTEVSGRLIKHLSKGFRQRVGLAQALLGSPKTLILDEPMVGLDPQQIIEMRDLIKHLSKDHAIMLSSHILPEVSAVCDEVIIINQGRLVVADTPDNLARHMEGQQHVNLEVKGDRSRIEKALGKLAGIDKIEFEQEKNSSCRLLVFGGEKDLREDIFYALAEAKCPILDMHVSSRSLEDIFLELTGKDSGKKRKAILKKSAEASKASAAAAQEAEGREAAEAGTESETDGEQKAGQGED